MPMSVYSVVMAVLWFSLAVLAGRVALWNAGKYGLVSVGIIFLLALIRIFVPLDLANAVLLESNTIYPALQRWIRQPLLGDLTLGMCLLFIWAAGTTVYLAMLGMKLLRQRAFRKDAGILDGGTELDRLFGQVCDELGCNKCGTLALSSRASTAYQTGFFQPYIILPQSVSALSEQDIRNMLRHELCHFQEHDLWIKLGAQAVAGLLWWNPVMRLFKQDVDLLLEMRCDRRVCRELSEEEQLAYLDTLLRLVKGSSVLTSTVSMGHLGQNADAEDIFRRFKLVLDGPTQLASKCKRVVAWIICIGLFFLSYFVMVQPISFPPDDELGDIVGVDLEYSYMIQTADGDYDVYCNDEYVFTIGEQNLDTEPFIQIPILDERMFKQ